MGKMQLNSEAYAAVQAELRSRYHYEDMSEDEKIEFDRKMDQIMELKEENPNGGKEQESPEKKDAGDQREPDGKDRIRDEMRKKYGYDQMTDEERTKFDEKLERAFESVEQERADAGEETDDTDDTDEPKVKKLVRTR